MIRVEARLAALSAMPLLTGCAEGLITTVGPDYAPAEASAAPDWQAPQTNVPIAHRGNPADLKRWWDQFGDVELSRFLIAAQRASASIADARSRIEQARAGMVGAIASGVPSLDAQVDADWAKSTFGGPTFQWTRYQFGLQSNWEVDLFGGIARQREAAQRQLDARHAAWHDARVAVAVEVANAYLSYRHCEVLVDIAEADAGSRKESARLTEIAGSAGLRAPADVALASASAADGQDTLMRQKGQCERAIKGLVALTGLSEAEVRHRLTGKPDTHARLPEPPPFQLSGLPARVLMQRPDVAAAEREVAEASATIGVEEAKRYPRLSLSGNITPQLQSVNGAPFFLAHTWSYGPTLNLPIFDAGKRAADVEAAKAKYEAAASKFRAVVRTAVKEVEEALVRLTNAESRLPQARSAAEGYRANFRAMQQLYQAGFGTLIDAEASRRQALNAERGVAELRQEWAAAWITLYRAAGGAWNDATDSTSAPDSSAHTPAERPTEPADAEDRS
ncbi:MAG: efflux transporter outer membrane subunit [Methylotetracoccus sp.]